MNGDTASIDMGDPEWEQKINKLRALESVERRQRQVEFVSLAPVYTAAKGGDLDEFIKALEKYSAEETASLYDIISTKSPCGNSLFHVTANIENADVFQALLEVVDDEQLVAQANNRGDTALHVAARARRNHMAKRLLKFDRIVDQWNNAGNRPLHEAVKNGDWELTNRLLHQGSESVNKKNNEGKCPLYLAIETHNLEILSLLLQAVDGNEVLSSWIEGMSPVHGAVVHRRIDMLKEMSKKKKELFDLKDAREDTPLHLAAQENYVDGVKFLVNEFTSSAFKHNIKGYFPIHVACKKGHLETIKVLHQHWQDWLDPEELLTLNKEQNILHIAAKKGMASVVKYILGDPKLEKLINAKDKYGNTPLHVATIRWQLEVLLSLTRDKRVNLGLVNHNNFTALDIVDEEMREIDAPLHLRLTRTILISAKAPRSKDKAISQTINLGQQREPPDIDTLKRRAEVRIVAATLIVSVTFTAGFSVPGGYNSSEPNAGIATLLNKPIYDVFVICNSIALYNSIIAAVILLWMQIDDSHATPHTLRYARLPLLIALVTMSVTYMVGVYMTISKRTWIAVVALIVGITALFIVLILYIAFFITLGYSSRLLQLFTDYIIRAAILISRSGTKGASQKYYFAGTKILKTHSDTRLLKDEGREHAPPRSLAPFSAPYPPSPPLSPAPPPAPYPPSPPERPRRHPPPRKPFPAGPPPLLSTASPLGIRLP
ncbi:protein ACCELERATED CELL DEATH 6-like [Eucalyptus grandis]|uniref:protein ACCELERATED CELL DEATH 6-like n=1 Tax=Eucalyptus grandis TaxID=71139 RepID=UPI00192EC3D2|nr:protein ACCELERATED CELL DEATH 6-like [Eucalyptus grandis]